MIAKAYRDEFSYMNGRAYLDVSTMGMVPERSRRRARTYLDDFTMALGRSDALSGRQIMQEAKQAVAALIHASPEDVFLTRNTTEGNNLLARGLPLAPGDEVIVCSGDFPAVYMPWTTRQAEGIRLTVVPGHDGVVDAEALIAAISERTRVIALSLAQSSSGYVADIMRLGAVCRQRGILLSVDAIQAMGRMPVYVDALPVDVLASGSFKGMLGVMGIGFCYVRHGVMPRIAPAVVSGNIDWSVYPMEKDFHALAVPSFPPDSRRMETGTGNVYGMAVMAESLHMLSEIGLEAIQKQIRTVESYYRQQLAAACLPVHVLGSKEPATWSGTVSFTYDPRKKEALSLALQEAEIYAAVRDIFRVSLHYYNTCDEIDRLMDVLSRVL